MAPDAKNPSRRLRALHPRDWQFVDEEGLHRIIEAVGVTDLDPDEQLSLGSSVEASAQSLIELWGVPAPTLKQEGVSAGIRESRSRAGRPINFAISTFFDSLIAAYSLAFNRPPGTSMEPIYRSPGGPLIRFLAEACDQIFRKLEDPQSVGVEHSVAESIRDLLNPFTTGSGYGWRAALRARVKRSRWRVSEGLKNQLQRAERRRLRGSKL